MSMLGGLRQNINKVRRKRQSSGSSSLLSDGDNPPTPPPASMDTIRQGLTHPLSGLQTKHSESSIVVKEAEVGVEREITSNREFTTMIHTSNGSAKTPYGNGTLERTASGYISISRIGDVSKSIIRTLCRQEDYSESFIMSMDIYAYRRYINDERLVHMPRKDSNWDRVLRLALLFGENIWALGGKVDTFSHGGDKTARVALAVGHDQAEALLSTFQALWELTTLVSNIGYLRGFDQMPSSIKEDTAYIFCDIVSLSGSIVTYYHQTISGLKHGASISFNFGAIFRKQISHIYQSKETLCDQIWTLKLNRREGLAGLASLRRELQPSSQPRPIDTLYSKASNQRTRSEHTCHWVRDSLAQFFSSDDQCLCITGPSGFGKTVLADWVEERLARPLDQASYTVLTYRVPFDSPKEATPLAFVKAILFQLLERRVGDVALFESLAKAFEAYLRDPRAEKLESLLWATLRNSLNAINKDGVRLVILTDGIDEMAAAKRNPVDFHKALRGSIDGLSNVRLITFTRPVSHLSDGCRHIVIAKQDVHEDIKTYFYQTFTKLQLFRGMSPSSQEQFVDKLAVKSKGNFLWAFFATRLLLREESHDAFVAASQSISVEISGLIDAVVVRLDLDKKQSLKYLLSFMAVSEEPFTVDEVAELLAVDVSKRAINNRMDVSEFVANDCGNLLVIHGDHVHFRAAGVRSHLDGLLGKALLSSKDAHYQLTIRLLLYARLSLTSRREPSVDVLDLQEVESILTSHVLLRYVLRNWVGHFHACSLVGTNGELTLTKDFHSFFPDSVDFALLERAFWHSREEYDLLERHAFVLEVRKACFGKQHITVFQTLVTLGCIHHEISVSGTEGYRYLYQAIQLGQAIFSKSSTILTTCTSLFLTYTETITITERTEIVTYREEMMRLMIEISIHKHGRNSDEVICWHEKLAQLYIDIKEEHRATAVYRELYEIVVFRFGKKSTKAREIGTYFGTLDIVLKGEKAGKEIETFERLIFETSEELEITNNTCITMFLRLAQSYAACGKIFFAERLYITLWRRISIACHAESRMELHITKIKIALEYTEFLRRQKRREEAYNILVCLWAEYEHFSTDDKELIIWIRNIGTTCKSIGLSSIAVSILTKVWGWFKSKGKGEDKESEETTILITEVVEEITTTAITEKKTTTTVTETTETVVKEIFETRLEHCRNTKVTRDLFSSCIALIQVYMQKENWAEATVIIKKTLEITWEAVLKAEVKLSLTEHFRKETVLIARRLAVCYHRQGLFEMAEQIHLRIFHACIGSLSVEDEFFTEAMTVLVAFYEEHHRHEKVIEIYIDVLERCRSQFSRGHKMTISMLYRLAEQYEMLGRSQDACKYYLEITSILNHGIGHCHGSAFKAAMFLCRHYHARKMWAELQGITTVLWKTIVHHRSECEITEDIIVEVYEKYSTVLEMHAKVEFSVRYNLAIEYREVITAVCGASSSALIIAMIAVARLCETHEEHYHESVMIYEEVLKKATTTKTTTATITERTVETVKTRLSRMYVTVITTGKGGKSSTYSVERAIQVSLEAYLRIKLEFGCWHEKTLVALKNVVILYHKVNTKETHLKMIELLQSSITEIITTVTVTMTLYTAASTLASIFVSVGLVAQGYELLQQLRHAIVFRNGLPSQSKVLKFDKHVSKCAFVFLAVFEYGLSSKDCVYSEIMADIVLESVLYDEYCRVIEHEKRLDVILECGSRLRGFWEEHKRVQFVETIDKRLFGSFKAEYGSCFKAINDEHVHLFYVAILAELGKDRSTTKGDFAVIACRAANIRVRGLLNSGDFHSAHQLGRCAFHFARNQQLYHRSSCLHYGYQLAELLAGIDAPHPTSGKEALSKDMLTTSRDIMEEVLNAFRAAHTDFTSLRIEDLEGLIHLLGAQKNYSELENLLYQLWDSREQLQRSGRWSPSLIINVGKLLAHAQYAHGNYSKAIDTAQLLWYNLRHGRGYMDEETLEVAHLVEGMADKSGQPAKAMAINEWVLRDIETVSSHGSRGNAAEVNQDRLSAEARYQLEYLRAMYHANKGWTKAEREFCDLHQHVKSTLKLPGPSFEEWSKGSVDEKVLGARYTGPAVWRITNPTTAVA